MTNAELVALAEKCGAYIDDIGIVHADPKDMQSIAAAIAERCAGIAEVKAANYRKMASEAPLAPVRNQHVFQALATKKIADAIRAQFPKDPPR